MSTVSSTADSTTNLYYLQNQTKYGDVASAIPASAKNSLQTASVSENIINQINGLVSLTKYTMDAMGIASDSKVTFSQLAKYRSQLNEQFDTMLKEKLEEKGIHEIPNFTITLQEDGSAIINSSSEYRETLQNIFNENEELLKNYKQIQALSGIDKAREAMQIAPNEMRKRIQIESLANWWADSGSNYAANYFSAYNNGSLSLLHGVNLSV